MILLVISNHPTGLPPPPTKKKKLYMSLQTYEHINSKRPGRRLPLPVGDKTPGSAGCAVPVPRVFWWRCRVAGFLSTPRSNHQSVRCAQGGPGSELGAQGPRCRLLRGHRSGSSSCWKVLLLSRQCFLWAGQSFCWHWEPQYRATWQRPQMLNSRS